MRPAFWCAVLQQLDTGDEQGAWDLAALRPLIEADSWCALCGVDEEANAELYARLCVGRHADTDKVEREVLRTLTDDEAFSEAQRASLFRVLNAAVGLEGVRFRQGMNYVAALLVAHEGVEERAFAVFAFLLRQRYALRLYSPESSALMGETLAQIADLARTELPELAAHLRTNDVDISTFAFDWLLTLFSTHRADSELSLYAVDLLLAGAPNVLLRFSAGLLRVCEAPLLAMGRSALLRESKAVLRAAPAPDVVRAAMAVPIFPPACAMRRLVRRERLAAMAAAHEGERVAALLLRPVLARAFAKLVPPPPTPPPPLTPTRRRTFLTPARLRARIAAYSPISLARRWRGGGGGGGGGSGGGGGAGADEAVWAPPAQPALSMEGADVVDVAAAADSPPPPPPPGSPSPQRSPSRLAGLAGSPGRWFRRR